MNRLLSSLVCLSLLIAAPAPSAWAQFAKVAVVRGASMPAAPGAQSGAISLGGPVQLTGMPTTVSPLSGSATLSAAPSALPTAAPAPAAAAVAAKAVMTAAIAAAAAPAAPVAGAAVVAAQGQLTQTGKSLASPEASPAVALGRLYDSSLARASLDSDPVAVPSSNAETLTEANIVTVLRLLLQQSPRHGAELMRPAGLNSDGLKAVINRLDSNGMLLIERQPNWPEELAVIALKPSARTQAILLTVPWPGTDRLSRRSLAALSLLMTKIRSGGELMGALRLDDSQLSALITELTTAGLVKVEGDSQPFILVYVLPSDEGKVRAVLERQRLLSLLLPDQAPSRLVLPGLRAASFTTTADTRRPGVGLDAIKRTSSAQSGFISVKAAAILTVVSALAIVIALPVSAIFSTALMAKFAAGTAAGAVAGGIVGLAYGFGKSIANGMPGSLFDIAMWAGSLVFGSVMGAALGGIGGIFLPVTLGKVWAGLGIGAVAGGVVGFVGGILKSLLKSFPVALSDLAVVAAWLVCGAALGAALGALGGLILPALIS